MTNEDLKIMQAWPLERKIRVSQSRIMKWYGHWGSQVYVSFSGGKDSTVLLDLARRVYPGIEAVFFDTGLEYPETREFVKAHKNIIMLKPKKRFDQIIKEYGYPCISKEVSNTVYYAQKNAENPNHWAVKILNGEYMYKGKVSSFNKKKWKFMLDAPFEVSDKCCYFLKKSPANDYTKKVKNIRSLGCWRMRGYEEKQHG